MNRVTCHRVAPGEYYVRCACGYLAHRKGYGARASALSARRDHMLACQNMVAP